MNSHSMMPGVKSMSLPSHTNVCFSGRHPHRPPVKLAFTRKDIQQANTKKRLIYQRYYINVTGCMCVAHYK